MVTQCMAALAVLGIVMTGLMVIVQVITVEQALHGIGRILAAAALAFTALCILRNLFRSLVVPLLSSVLPALAIAAAILFAIVVLGVVTKVVVMRVMNRDARSSRRSDHD